MVRLTTLADTVLTPEPESVALAYTMYLPPWRTKPLTVGFPPEEAEMVALTLGATESTVKVLALDTALVLPAASPWVAWTV